MTLVNIAFNVLCLAFWLVVLGVPAYLWTEYEKKSEKQK